MSLNNSLSNTYAAQLERKISKFENEILELKNNLKQLKQQSSSNNNISIEDKKDIDNKINEVKTNFLEQVNELNHQYELNLQNISLSLGVQSFCILINDNINILQEYIDNLIKYFNFNSAPFGILRLSFVSYIQSLGINDPDDYPQEVNEIFDLMNLISNHLHNLITNPYTFTFFKMLIDSIRQFYRDSMNFYKNVTTTEKGELFLQDVFSAINIFTNMELFLINYCKINLDIE
jgi:hypothetical protein